MSMDWLVKQLEASASLGESSPSITRFNPKPPGQHQPGSATEAVLGFLSRRPGVFHAHEQIIAACHPHTRSAVAWALRRLRAWGRIEVVVDSARNPRFLLYRLIKVRPETANNG